MPDGPDNFYSNISEGRINLRYNWNMTHYICTGGCGGVSEKPGVCQATDCPLHDKPLVQCGCAAIKHTTDLERVKTEAHKTALLARNIVFGVEDSLVSTVGLISGIAAAQVPGPTIVITGIILIIVEAISMAVGSFLSEEYALESVEKKDVALGLPFFGSAIMFFSYTLAGLIPLLPYTVFEVSTAFYLSIVCSLAALFILGAVSVRRTLIETLHHGLKMLILGGLAIVIGVLLGSALKTVF